MGRFPFTMVLGYLGIRHPIATNTASRDTPPHPKRAAQALGCLRRLVRTEAGHVLGVFLSPPKVVAPFDTSVGKHALLCRTGSTCVSHSTLRRRDLDVGAGRVVV